MRSCQKLRVARSQGRRHGPLVSRIALRSFFETRRKRSQKRQTQAKNKMNQISTANLIKKSKQTQFFAEEFSSFGHSTLFVIGTRQMGLPILRVVVLHSHNPDGPQIWHAFNLHWPEWDQPARSQIEQGTFVRKSGVKLVTGLTNFSHRHSPKMHYA